MTFMKNLFIIALIIIIIALVAPEQYQKGEDWVFDKVPILEKLKFWNTKLPYTLDAYGKNYGDLGGVNCTNSVQCKDYFDLGNTTTIICHEDYGFCYVEVDLNDG